MVVSQEYGFHLECSAGEGWSHQLHGAWLVSIQSRLWWLNREGETQSCAKNKEKVKKWKKKKCCDKPKGRKNLPLMVFPPYQFGYYSCFPKDQFVPMKMCDFVIPTLYFLEPSLWWFFYLLKFCGLGPSHLRWKLFLAYSFCPSCCCPPLSLMSLLWCGLTSNEILHRYGHMHTVDLCWTALSFPLVPLLPIAYSVPFS